jgi:hypothetical protein
MSAFWGLNGVAPSKKLIDSITDEGLTSGLVLCLDAGDENSYDPGVQTAKWLDVSGNGYDFYRGSSVGGDGAEPTFNGSAGGKSGNEYFSFDGGDYFTYDSANEAWMNSLHSNTAQWSVFFAMRGAFSSPFGNNFIFGTTESGTGCRFTWDDNGALYITVYPGSSSATLNFSGSTKFGQDYAIGYGVSINSGLSQCLINGSTNTQATSLTGNASAADGTMRLGGLPGPAQLAGNGARMYYLAVWNGVVLTTTQLKAIWEGVRGRFTA